eukprot:1134918-Amphidinium_carterae.1
MMCMAVMCTPTLVGVLPHCHSGGGQTEWSTDRTVLGTSEVALLGRVASPGRMAILPRALKTIETGQTPPCVPKVQNLLKKNNLP